MKRIFILSALLLASCSLNDERPSLDEGKEMTVYAKIESSKTTNDGLDTKWALGDKASLIHCQTGGTTFYSSCFTYSGDDSFSGKSSNTSALNDWFFVYPYSPDNLSAKAVNVCVSRNQIQSGNNSTAHLCGENFPIFGVSKGVPESSVLELSLANALSVGKIVITNSIEEPITVHSIKMVSSTTISGEYSVDLTDSEPGWSAKSGAGSSVSLTVQDGSPIRSGETAEFYLGFVPHVATFEGITVSASRSGASPVTYFISRSNPNGDVFRAGMFKTMKIRYDESHRIDGTQSKLNQSLSFPHDKLIWNAEDGIEIGGTYKGQALKGAATFVSYSSGDQSVATVSGNLITVNGYGTTTITASAEGNEDYNPANASYTLTISKGQTFNLENPSVTAFMDEAEKQYTDANYKEKTIVGNYISGLSSSNRLDAPAPVSLSWTSTVTGTKTVSVYNDSDMTDLELTATTNTNTASIMNLVPGRRYWYNVSVSGGGSVASGHFDTDGRRRMLLVSNTYAKGHANNCRDLGGLKTIDGKTIKYGLIFRGSNMDRTTDAEKSIITDYMNVGLDIDLRSTTASYYSGGEDGKATSNNPWTGTWSGKVTYNNDGKFGGSFSPDFKVGTANAKFTAVFTQILNTIRTGKAAYIHCHVGADRTGYVCLMLESVLGVSSKDCTIDFELTSFSVVGKRLRTGDGTHNMCKDALNYINSYSKGNTYQEKVYNILLDYGITDAQIQEFKSIMLE